MSDVNSKKNPLVLRYPYLKRTLYQTFTLSPAKNSTSTDGTSTAKPSKRSKVKPAEPGMYDPTAPGATPLPEGYDMRAYYARVKRAEREAFEEEIRKAQNKEDAFEITKELTRMRSDGMAYGFGPDGIERLEGGVNLARTLKFLNFKTGGTLEADQLAEVKAIEEVLNKKTMTRRQIMENNGNPKSDGGNGRNEMFFK
ncbi:hypothetical protein EDC01DRAFT_626545 [Geopyxis carbonaria]|nr:hypothetical protein EDC01DRAFT_626545 [Geopyxis carbonaria]